MHIVVIFSFIIVLLLFFSKKQANIQPPHNFPPSISLTQDVIDKSIVNQTQLKITYNDLHRIINPYYVTETHIYAWCSLRQEPRTFNINNITSCEILNSFFNKDALVAKYLWEQKEFFSKKSYSQWLKEQKHQVTAPQQSFTFSNAENILKGKKVLWIKYISSKKEITERKVNIYALDRDFFHAWCHNSKRIKNFRYGRVLEWKPLDDSYKIRKRPSPDTTPL